MPCPSGTWLPLTFFAMPYTFPRLRCALEVSHAFQSNLIANKMVSSETNQLHTAKSTDFAGVYRSITTCNIEGSKKALQSPKTKLGTIEIKITISSGALASQADLTGPEKAFSQSPHVRRNARNATLADSVSHALCIDDKGLVSHCNNAYRQPARTLTPITGTRSRC